MKINDAVFAIAACLVFGALSGNVAAEPLTTGAGALPAAVSPETDTAVESRQPGTGASTKSNAPAVVERSSVGSDVPSTSKTIDLLLELQGKNPGLQGGERPKAEMPTSRPSVGQPAAAKPAFGAVPAAPVGSASAARSGPAAADPQAVDWSEPLHSRQGGAGALPAVATAPREPFGPAPAAVRRIDDDEGWWRIPRRVIGYVRENRNTVVLASAALLLLLWAATAITSRRRK